MSREVCVHGVEFFNYCKKCNITYENEERNKKDNKISRDAIARLFPLYSAQLCDRLRAGAETYGDSSFGKGPDELLNEIQEELLDVSGWAFILWCRIEKLQARLQEQKDGKE